MKRRKEGKLINIFLLLEMLHRIKNEEPLYGLTKTTSVTARLTRFMLSNGLVIRIQRQYYLTEKGQEFTGHFAKALALLEQDKN